MNLAQLKKQAFDALLPPEFGKGITPNMSGFDVGDVIDFQTPLGQHNANRRIEQNTNSRFVKKTGGGPKPTADWRIDRRASHRVNVSADQSLFRGADGGAVGTHCHADQSAVVWCGGR